MHSYEHVVLIVLLFYFSLFLIYVPRKPQTRSRVNDLRFSGSRYGAVSFVPIYHCQASI